MQLVAVPRLTCVVDGEKTERVRREHFGTGKLQPPDECHVTGPCGNSCPWLAEGAWTTRGRAGASSACGSHAYGFDDAGGKEGMASFGYSPRLVAALSVQAC